MKGLTADQLIADAEAVGVELGDDVKAALHTLDGHPQLIIVSPWSSALTLWLDFDGEAHVATTQEHNVTVSLLAKTVAEYASASGSFEDGD